MLARWLRWWLVVQVVLVAVGALLLTRAGWAGPAGAVPMAAAALMAGYGTAIGIAYAVARWHASPAPLELRGGPLAPWLGGVAEWLAFMWLYTVVQPFPRFWLNERQLGRGPAGGRRPVLLVHGYLCNRGIWWWMARQLRRRGLACTTVDLEPPLGSITPLADLIHARISELTAATGAERVDVVAHSMGGLAVRAYLRRFGTGRVAKVITLGTPYQGTWLARLGPGRNAREMRPRSSWLKELQASAIDVPLVSVWSVHDEIIAPQDSSRLGGAREEVVFALGHFALVFSRRVLAVIVQELCS